MLLSPSLTLGESMDSVGVGSSSMIVPVPNTSGLFGIKASATFIPTVSFGSSRESVITGNSYVWMTSPGSNSSIQPVIVA